jgi:hypothetical protein
MNIKGYIFLTKTNIQALLGDDLKEMMADVFNRYSGKSLIDILSKIALLESKNEQLTKVNKTLNRELVKLLKYAPNDHIIDLTEDGE